MPTDNNVTFTGPLLRERDKKIIEKYEKEKGELERRLQKIKHSSEETAKELFDAVNRGRRLARSLGFEDVYEAQIFIDSVEHEVSFKDCMARFKILEAELRCEKKEVAVLQAKLAKTENSRNVQAELEKVKAELSNSEIRHKEVLKGINERYDALRANKERAAERYKADFKKWREFNKWLFAEDDEHRKRRTEAGILKEERKRRDLASVMRKRQKMIEIGPYLARFEGELEGVAASSTPPPIGHTEQWDGDKENDGACLPSPRKANILAEEPAAHEPPAQQRDTPLKVVTNLDPPFSSPSVFFTTTSHNATNRAPLDFHPISNTTAIKQEPESALSPLRNKPVKRAYPHIPSSDTEDDSQAVFMPSTNPQSGKASIFKVPAPPPTITRPETVPSQCVFTPPSSAHGAIMRLRYSGTESQSDKRPSKVRRLSEDMPSESSIPPYKKKASTPASTSKAQKEHAIGKTPAIPKQLHDYSVFKGRGRYGGQNQDSEKTINALYTIDPTKNNGRSYQYDEVIRSKEDRRRMHAGDCDCCRQYYENVGPLPNRLQPPPWRSPSTTPSKSCRRHSDQNTSDSALRETEINAHRQTISRHRHTWERAKTPPGYWDIGFPTTQEVGDINERAKQMQRKKLDEVATESGRLDGKYRKK